MGSNERLKINFDDLADGWLTVRLASGSHEYTFFPSHVPYDSIQELADGLGNLLSGYSQASTCWNDEPVEHEFIFERTNDQLSFRVMRCHQTSFGKEFEEVFAAQGTLYQIIRPFWVALRDLETRYLPEEYQRHWGEPFPVNEMRLFTELLNKLKLAQE